LPIERDATGAGFGAGPKYHHLGRGVGGAHSTRHSYRSQRVPLEGVRPEHSGSAIRGSVTIADTAVLGRLHSHHAGQ
jgi:hypothetical protein